MNRVEAIYRIMPDCAISSDMIAGFCSETEEEHQDTLSMIGFARYSMSYMFMYSERPGTPAAKKLTDDIPEEVKKRRLQEIVDAQMSMSLQVNLADIGKELKVLIEGDSKRSDQEFKGRTSQNKMVNFPKQPGFGPGDYVVVKITDASSGSLRGTMVDTQKPSLH
jgi:tRNA-2-methylthio-N6-dimethylallyladenosine synthase